MRCLVLLFLATLPSMAADWKIDHVTIAGKRLDLMRQAFTAVTGIPTENGGPHGNRATEMSLTSFPDGSYLELIAIQPQADQAAVSAHTWNKALWNNAGPCAFAVTVPDLSAEVARLKTAGVSIKATERSGRTRPDGTRLSWETTDIGPAPRGSLFPFLIRDLTPRENRAYLSGKPTTDRFRGIAKIVIGVQDLNTAVAQYRRALNAPEPRRQRDPEFDATLAWFEGTPFVLAQGLSETSWLTLRVRDYGEMLCAVILSATGGMMGAKGSNWFGAPILWSNEARLRWRLGIEVPRAR